MTKSKEVLDAEEAVHAAQEQVRKVIGVDAPVGGNFADRFDVAKPHDWTETVRNSGSKTRS